MSLRAPENPLDVPPLEHGVLRVFQLDQTDPRVTALIAGAAEGDIAEPASQLLGAGALAGDWLDLVRLSDLGALSLTELLTQGYDLPEGALTDVAAHLDAAEGAVLIVNSPAFGQRATTLAPGPGATLLARIDTKAPLDPVTPMAPDQSEGPAAPPAPAAPATRSSGRASRITIAVLALVTFAFLLALLFGSAR